MDKELLDNNRKDYRKVCAIEQTIPIYSRDWWLDAVCGKDNWNVLLVKRDGKIVASLPYYNKKCAFLNYIGQPPLTKNNGIWMKYPNLQKNTTKLKYEKDIITEIIDKINHLRAPWFKQNFHYTFTNWLPFYWANYKQQSYYSYVISDLSDLNSVFQCFDAKIKTDIRKAEKIITVNDDINLVDFYQICVKTFERKGIKTPFSFDILKSMDEACILNKCRKIYYAKDSSGAIHAGIYIVWDNESVYYILGGGDPKLRNSGATSLLLWKAIQFASTLNLKFDFEGSMMPSVESFFRAFGGEQKQYFEISKVNSMALRAIFAFKYVLKGK